MMMNLIDEVLHILNSLRAYIVFVMFVILVILIIVHVFKRKLAKQEKIIQRQKLFIEKLEKVEELKAGFFVNTSHELRTPLNGIIGICNSFNGGAFGKMSEKARSNIMIVLNSSKRLLKMADDILDLTLMNKGEFTIETATLNFKDVLDDCLGTLETLAKEKNLRLINNVDGTLPLIEADPHRLQQIIFNIVGNAIKFTWHGRIELGAEVKEKLLEVYVKDTGEGIPKEKLEHIFEEFVRVESDKNNQKQGKGTGIGLAIAKNLIDLMGGEISIDSVVEEGSVCRFSLPISDKKEALGISSGNLSDHSQYIVGIKRDGVENDQDSDSSDVSINPVQYNYKILIVDDNSKDRTALTDMFISEINFTVLIAENGLEAVKMVEKESDIDLVIMDVMMPVMSGIEATKRIRGKFSHYELPIVMVTAKTQGRDILEGFSAGTNDYVVKPYDKEVLKARCRNLLGLRRGVRVALEKAKTLKDEKQRRMFSEMLTEVASEVSKTLNTSKALSLVTSRIQSYFGFEKSAGCIMLEDGMKFVGIESKEERDELLASFLENMDEVYIKKAVRFAVRNNYKKIIENIKNKGIKSKTPWRHFPIYYNEKLHGIISVCEYKYLPLEESSINVIKAIIGHVAAFIENSKLYGRVKTLATVDALTGLNNRRNFFEKALAAYNHALFNKLRYSIIMMDIDNFKSINDTYGHGIGDETLKEIGRVLKRVSSSNVLLGRFGGEEFIVGCLGGTEVFEIAEDIRKKIEASQIDIGDGKTLKVTVSVGLSTNLAQEKTIEPIIKRADENLYKAKKSGKNRVVYDEKEYE